MTRLKTTWLACLVLGLTFGGTALAQAPQQPNTAPPIEAEADVDVDAPDVDVDTPDVDVDAPDVDVDAPDVDVDARAPDAPDVYVAPPPPADTTVVVTDMEPDYMERYGVTVALGGGTSGFTNDAMRDSTDLGGDWGVRLSFGTQSPLAIEASYIGSAQNIEALGLDDDAILVGNGAQAALRLNGTFDLPVQPFIFGGAAWRRYDLTNEDFNTSAVNDSDDVLELPVGLGIAGKWSGLVLDLRGEFRPTLDNDLMPTFGIDDDEDIGNDEFAAMHRWGVNASIGYEF